MTKTEEKIEAVIKEAKIYTNNIYLLKKFDTCSGMGKLWEKEPKTLNSDSDIILITVKTKEDKTITELFPVLLKYDGSLETTALSKKSQGRRQNFISFLKYYKITDDVKEYNIPANINKWKGKEIKVVETWRGLNIFIP